MASTPSWIPIDVDPTRPSVARVYDFYLGGSHNFESDRTFGQQAVRAFPELPVIIRDNRHFLRRAVLQLLDVGIDQFLDLGSGIPTAGNVHEVVHAVNPQARVLYVDHDPVAVTHSHALLQGDEFADAILGDVREPHRILADAVATGLIDLDRPLAVLMVAVLHFLGEDDSPELVAEYMGATARGSHLALTHARKDGDPGMVEAGKVYDQSRSPNPMRLKTGSEIKALFGDLTIVEPGVVPLPRWRPELDDDGTPERVVGDDYPGLAGVGRRD